MSNFTAEESSVIFSFVQNEILKRFDKQCVQDGYSSSFYAFDKVCWSQDSKFNNNCM